MAVKEKTKVIIIVHTILSDKEISMIKEQGYAIAYIVEHIKMDEIIKVDYPFEDNENTIQSVDKIIQKIVLKYQVERIFTLNEYYIEFAAMKAKQYMLSYWGVNEDAAKNCRNKKITKKVFQQHNIPQANYILLRSSNEILWAIQKLNFPMVVKPSNGSGSKMVYICENMQQLIDSVYRVYEANELYAGIKVDSEILIEEYLEGTEYSAETYTIHGESKVVAITEKETVKCTEIAHTVPAKFTSKVSEQIKNTVVNALKALHVEYGVTHTELKITKEGVKIIEVNGRVAGDNIPILVERVTGINLRQLALSIALDASDKHVETVLSKAKSATIRYFISEKEGIFHYDTETMMDKDDLVQIYYQNGQPVKKTIDNFTRLGYIIVSSNNEEYSKDKATNVARKFNVLIQ